MGPSMANQHVFFISLDIYAREGMSAMCLCLTHTHICCVFAMVLLQYVNPQVTLLVTVHSLIVRDKLEISAEIYSKKYFPFKCGRGNPKQEERTGSFLDLEGIFG